MLARVRTLTGSHRKRLRALIGPPPVGGRLATWSARLSPSHGAMNLNGTVREEKVERFSFSLPGKLYFFGFGVGFGGCLLLVGDADVFFDADGGFFDVGGAEGAR